MPDSPDHIYVVDGLSNRQRKSCRFKIERGLNLTDWGVKLIFNYTRDCVYNATLP